MKITRRQLSRLIEASVIKKSNYGVFDDYVSPIEEPLKDPRDIDFDLSDENKDKLLDLAASDDDKTRTQADNLADTIGFPSSGRFGADTLSKQMKMYDMGLDLLNDPEIDQVVNVGVNRYFNQRRRDSFAIDLNDILRAGYRYPEGPGGFQLYLEGDPEWYNKINPELQAPDVADEAALDITAEEPHLHIDIIHGIMDEIRFVLKIKFKNVQSISNNVELTRAFLEPETEEALKTGEESKEQRAAKLKKAYNLFKRYSAEERIKIGPAIVQHIYDKAMQPMYEIFTTTIQKHNPKQDMSLIKEVKMKISRKELRKLIAESMFDGGGDSRERRNFDIEMFIGTVSTLINANSLDFDDGLASGFFGQHHDTFETLLNSSDILTVYKATADRNGNITFDFHLNRYGGVLNAVIQFIRQTLLQPGAKILPPSAVERAGEDCIVRYLRHNSSPERFVIHVEKIV